MDEECWQGQNEVGILDQEGEFLFEAGEGEGGGGCGFSYDEDLVLHFVEEGSNDEEEGCRREPQEDQELAPPFNTGQTSEFAKCEEPDCSARATHSFRKEEHPSRCGTHSFDGMRHYLGSKGFFKVEGKDIEATWGVNDPQRMIFDHYVRFLNPMLERVDEKIQEARPGVDIATISPEEKGIYVLRMWVAPYFQQFLIPHMNQKLEAHDQLKRARSWTSAAGSWCHLHGQTHLSNKMGDLSQGGPTGVPHRACGRVLGMFMLCGPICCVLLPCPITNPRPHLNPLFPCT